MVCTCVFPLSYVEDCTKIIFFIYTPVCLWREKCIMLKWGSPNQSVTWGAPEFWCPPCNWLLMIRKTQLYQILGGDLSWTSLLCPWTGSSYEWTMIWNIWYESLKTRWFEKKWKFDVKTCWFEEVKVWCINLLIGKKWKFDVKTCWFEESKSLMQKLIEKGSRSQGLWVSRGQGLRVSGS